MKMCCGAKYLIYFRSERFFSQNFVWSVIVDAKRCINEMFTNCITVF